MSWWGRFFSRWWTDTLSGERSRLPFRWARRWDPVFSIVASFLTFVIAYVTASNLVQPNDENDKQLPGPGELNFPENSAPAPNGYSIVPRDTLNKTLVYENLTQLNAIGANGIKSTQQGAEKYIVVKKRLVSKQEFLRYLESIGDVRRITYLKRMWSRAGRPVFTEPATHINYQEALEYAEWLSSQLGYRFRLPTIDDLFATLSHISMNQKTNEIYIEVDYREWIASKCLGFSHMRTNYGSDSLAEINLNRKWLCFPVDSKSEILGFRVVMSTYANNVDD